MYNFDSFQCCPKSKTCGILDQLKITSKTAWHSFGHRQGPIGLRCQLAGSGEIYRRVLIVSLQSRSSPSKSHRIVWVDCGQWRLIETCESDHLPQWQNKRILLFIGQHKVKRHGCFGGLGNPFDWPHSWTVKIFGLECRKTLGSLVKVEDLFTLLWLRTQLSKPCSRWAASFTAPRSKPFLRWPNPNRFPRRDLAVER